MAKAKRTQRLTTLEPVEQDALRARLRAPGRPVGPWIAAAWGLAPATVLGAAAGLPCRESVATHIRAKLVEKGTI